MSIFAPLLAPSRSSASLLSRAFAAGSIAVRSAVAPQTLFVPPTVEPTPETAATVKLAPSETVSSELPTVEDIEDAASTYFRAADQARTADRAKRRARKLLDLLPVGRYGAWDITRESSARETADLDTIRATYARLGLGEVPMKTCAPSLKVARIEAEAVAA
jgi:hypothetical protein